ncbi:MAG: hypothetical protein JNJ46_07090 [Myxococcales bacterium]|nr:hypothetical protein [Myxococcales bacterium]
MKRTATWLAPIAGLAVSLGCWAGCGDTTGGARVAFDVAAAGPSDATGGALTFMSPQGYRVTLDRARLYIGALYLNQTVPTSGAQETGCIRPGIYVAQATGSLWVDALSPQQQPFATRGEGIASEAKAGELWLTAGDIQRIDDNTVIVDAAGTAQRGGQSYPFEAQLSIGRNRLIPSMDPAYPGTNPICKQRIVSLIPTDLIPQEGGTLLLRIDPRRWFDTVDFSQVPKVQDSPALYRFSNRNDNPADLSLFNNGIRSRSGPYSFSWQGT